MKKTLLFTTFILCGMIVFSQIYPDHSATATNRNQPSPNIIKTVYLTNLTGKAMQAYPNPATDQVIVQHVSSAERASIFVLNADGKILQQRTVVPNELQTRLQVGMLSKGIYIVRYDNGKGDVRTLQLVKN